MHCTRSRAHLLAPPPSVRLVPHNNPLWPATHDWHTHAHTTWPLPLSPVACRYFTPGFLMVALHMQPPTRPQLLATIALYVAIDAATMFLFIKRPFHWPDGSVARFMW